MSKDFAQIANDVIAGVGLLQRSAPDTMKAFGSLSTAATASKAIDTKTKELMALAIGNRGPLRRLRRLPREDGPSAWGQPGGGRRDRCPTRIQEVATAASRPSG